MPRIARINPAQLASWMKDHFPWLGTDEEDVSGADTVEKLSEVYDDLVGELQGAEEEPPDDDDDDGYNPLQDLDDYGELTPRAKSALDPGGVYNMAGDCIGRIRCGCEDYPCCGH
jgi:hypothetical protein